VQSYSLGCHAPPGSRQSHLPHAGHSAVSVAGAPRPVADGSGRVICVPQLGHRSCGRRSLTIRQDGSGPPPPKR